MPETRGGNIKQLHAFEFIMIFLLFSLRILSFPSHYNITNILFLKVLYTSFVEAVILLLWSLKLFISNWFCAKKYILDDGSKSIWFHGVDTCFYHGSKKKCLQHGVRDLVMLAADQLCRVTNLLHIISLSAYFVTAQFY